MRHFAIIAAAAAAFALAAPAAADPVIGRVAQDFRLTNSNGQEVQLSQFRGRTIVLEWNNPGCPYVQRHYDTGNMQRTQAEAERRGVVWLTINSGAEGRQGFMRGPEANAFVARVSSRADHYLLDHRGVVGRAYDAATTPQMFVIDEGGVLRYNGAIDDAPHASAVETSSATNYVVAALRSLEAGRAVDPATSRPYGCSVKYADEAGN
ncbi:MAG: redoxin domain-containing protein [Sphingomonadaceae bacterium]|nr:redoxin domain-containing protein [Sphingomonadaceae bacterium]